MRYLDVIVPVKNEAENINDLVRRIYTSLNDAGIAHEIIFVDDKSTDSTIDIIHQLAKDFPVRVYSKQGKKGKAFSIIEGARYSTADVLVMIDGDLQYPPEAIPEMFEKSINHGVVVAKRQKYGGSKIRKFVSSSFKQLFGKLLFNFDCDVQSGLKLFRREILESINENEVSAWSLDVPLLNTAIDLGHTIGEVDIDFAPRQNGNSKVSTFKTSLEIGSQSLAFKLRPKKVYPIHSLGREMKGAGVSYNRLKYVTHTTLHSDNSAIKVLSFGQKIWLWLLLISLIAILIWNFLFGLQLVVAVLSFIYFVDVIFNFYLIYKSLHTPPEITVSDAQLEKIKESDLPVYTVLCPLYKEASVLPIFLDSISKMDWPKNKLEVMLLLEEDDKETQEAAKNLKLPSYVKVVVVPDSLPKTKPKACNYGLTQATGEYLVIYDAEDVPDPLQLKKAYAAFQSIDPNVICLQAKLNYHNPFQNLLTRLFTAEYSLWFDVTLPGLQSIATTIPLGGTSNHFRTEMLRSLEGWDPFNVTEDCDLGLRLFHEGYKTAIIDSTTLEEANSNVRNWIRQRSRWIKGYMQTYLVHMRNPIEAVKKQGWHSLVFQMVVGGKIAFIFINPFLWVMTILYFVLRPLVGPAIESLYPVYIFYMAGFSLIFGNFLFMYYYMIGVAKREQWSLVKYVLLVPLYWLLVSWAGFLALYQLIVKPHYWEKTIHGLHLEKVKELVTEEKIAPIAIETVEQREHVHFGRKFKNKIRGFIGDKKIVLAGSVFVLANAAANFINFGFNAYLGRVLTVEDFGNLTLVSSLLFLSAIPINALASTTTQKVAYLFGKYSQSSSRGYLSHLWRRVLIGGVALSGLWLLLTPYLPNFFNTDSVWLFLLFTPVWLLSLSSAVYGGYLKGTLAFAVLAIIAIFEPIVKFLVAFIIVQAGYHNLVYLSILISTAMPLLLSFIYVFKQNSTKVESTEAKFNTSFYTSAVLYGLANIAFLGLDIVLVKHFLNPVEAGQYALLSLAGKIVYFFGTLTGTLMLPLVAHSQGAKKDSEKIFIWLFSLTCIMTICAASPLLFFGNYLMPFLFGDKAYAILSYLPFYLLTMLMFSLSQTIVSYFQAKENYFFVTVGFIVSICQIVLISLLHKNLLEVIMVMFGVSAINLTLLTILFIFRKSLWLVSRNLVDLVGIFKPVYKKNFDLVDNVKGLRILIFNWRDTKHVWAGGAEVYIHELAKRWVADGHRVTIFCGNDSKNPRNEVIDGVQMVRRGGFYTVYFWAIVYYLSRFRGLFDVVIDSENGLPFFTPLFVKVPKFLLIHHIHQEVFRTHLVPPFSYIAMFLEARIMPLVYKNQAVITVSESSKREILKIKLGNSDSIQIINPGINPNLFKKTKKTSYPSYLYLGRLQDYKNIDIAIKAFKHVSDKYPDAKFTIAGFGESLSKLQKLVNSLDLGEHVVFTGRVTNEEKSRLMSSHWVFIQPSMLEGWGITVIEANASYTPVIASNVNGLKDSVSDRVSGFLVNPKSIDGFAEAMLDLAANSRLRNKLSRQAYHWSKNFDWDTSAQSFSKILQQHLEDLNGKLIRKLVWDVTK